MKFGSVCSGIEAASVAWEPLGWKAAWFSEIEPFPSAVLSHHYADTPNLGDMTTLPGRITSGEVEAPDLFCGGTPCQAFSVAGLRKSLDDARGNLSLTFCEIANAIDNVRSARGEQSCIVFWENVPGVLSTKDNAFGCFLGALAGSDTAIIPHGRWSNAGVVAGPQRTVAWRTLDAQYFGVAQRRKRVFVVASARDGFDPAAVLLEFDGVRRDSAPRREAWQVAPTIPSRSTAGGGLGTDFDCDGGVIQQKQWPAEVSSTLDTTFGTKQGLEDQHVNAGCSLFVPAFQGIAHSLRGEGFDASEDGVAQPISYGIPGNWIGRAPENGGNSTQFMEEVAPCLTSADKHGVAQPVAFHPTQDPISSSEVCHSIGANENATAAVATIYQDSEYGVAEYPTAGSLRAGRIPEHQMTLHAMQVRRLTPKECERLQGFPDGYTAIPWRKKSADECPDGPRYKALGNSWAVPVVRWIGSRIQEHINAP